MSFHIFLSVGLPELCCFSYFLESLVFVTNFFSVSLTASIDFFIHIFFVVLSVLVKFCLFWQN